MKKFALVAIFVVLNTSRGINAENNISNLSASDEQRISAVRNQSAQETIQNNDTKIESLRSEETGHRNSIDKAFDLLHEIPIITNDFIYDFPLETLTAAAVFGVLMPKLTLFTACAGLVIKYKNTEVSEKISLKVDKVIDFLKNEWKDITDNYGTKKQ